MTEPITTVAPPPAASLSRFPVAAGLPLVVLGSMTAPLLTVAPASAAEAGPVRAVEPLHATTSQVSAPRPTVERPVAIRSVAVRATEEPPAQYLVVAGDTVSGIASRFGLRTDSILALNGLSRRSLIFPRQVLALAAEPTAPPVAAPAPPAPPTPPAAAGATPYTIRPGDTLTRIAIDHGTTVSALLDANGLARSSVIYAGRTLTIPGASAPAPAPAPTPRPVPAAAPRPEAPPAPPTAHLVPLSAEMRANAAVIAAVGREAGAGDRGIIIALVAAMQESSLRNISHGDGDSLGLFQQRPSMGWGAPAEILDPSTSARSFFGGSVNPHPGTTRGLLDIAGWQSMSVGQAAQAVQVSAYPALYERWEASARAWLPTL